MHDRLMNFHLFIGIVRVCAVDFPCFGFFMQFFGSLNSGVGVWSSVPLLIFTVQCFISFLLGCFNGGIGVVCR